MACTIVSTPALGASDWSTFITQVTGLKRGFMEVNYTNFASTAASAIATGGVIEVAGSFYVFSETAIDYSTTTSANADLYIYAQPSAGGTTCTVVALTAAPIWRDDYQGFYASAASLNRAIGGLYVASAGTYSCKYIYDSGTVADCLLRNATRPILHVIEDLGEWNMDSTLNKTITTRIPVSSKYRQATAVIMADDGVTWKLLAHYDTAGVNGGLSTIGAYSLVVQRLAGGVFDAATYDGTASTVPNRGYVLIDFVA